MLLSPTLLWSDNVSDKRKETNAILTEYNMLMKQNDLGEEEGRPLIYAYKENI